MIFYVYIRMELEKLHIFRMIHIDNIPHVVKFGITGKTVCI